MLFLAYLCFFCAYFVFTEAFGKKSVSKHVTIRIALATMIPVKQERNLSDWLSPREHGARSIQPKFQPVRPGKVVHLRRRTRFFETFPVGQNRSIDFWTEISGNFGWMDHAHDHIEEPGFLFWTWRQKEIRITESYLPPVWEARSWRNLFATLRVKRRTRQWETWSMFDATTTKRRILRNNKKALNYTSFSCIHLG